MTSQPPSLERPVTVADFQTAKSQGRKLVVVTAYDFPMARLCDQAGVDAILVGDSLGMVVQGYPDCLSVTLDQMLYHAGMVSRAVRRALVIADLPFMSYQASVRQALSSAGRMLKEARVHAVKLEGGQRSRKTIRRLVEIGIPVMGHVGLTPQSYHALGGYRVQRDENRLIEDALAVEEAGAFAVVLECVPAESARRLTARLRIPTIGIGAGAGCDGQVLVSHDLLGLHDGFKPRFVKAFADLRGEILRALSTYCREVREGTFPAPEHEFK
ncbi:MAG: 3-methyl-2-oxobutanoate hydroxymethyltransferase [Gemmatales bacterium]|nr:3-methyl-2-oxobutanoate hydroxymethyltransferase [Gemmatales bacterium]MDW8387674.1 3-methyl-2-oxobutanoate hydroxymethyltransferase [Gemmatales bacterium]